MNRIASLALLSMIILSAFNMVASHLCFGEEWIVEVISSETGIIKSSAWVPENCFRKNETVSLRVTAVNRGSVSKKTRITVTICDRMDQPIGYNEELVTIPPKTTNTVYIPIGIPSWTASGEAVAHTNALQVIEGVPLGPPYCPETITNLTVYAFTSKTVVDRGYTTSIELHVKNVYAMESIKFDLPVCYDDHDGGCHVIRQVNDTVLQVDESKAFILVWNTSGIPYGLYSMYAFIHFTYPQLNDEILEHATVTLTVPGDVNGDFRVNMQDYYNIISHFGGKEGSPRYVANYDINCDGTIDMLDFYITIAHFGQHAP